MNLLPFRDLPAYRPRHFVPQNIDLGEWNQIAPLFDALETRAPQCQSAAEFERWLLDGSELAAALDEEGSRRYIAMTCHTENSEAEKAYLQFVEQIEPALKPRRFKLAQLFLAHPRRSELAKERYFVFDRDTQLQVELFRPENVPLETEEAKLSQQYQKLIGSLTVQFRGEERTLAQMGRYLEDPDRALRQETWELVSNRRLQEAGQIETVFEQLLELRQKIAANAGFPNYLAYAFRARGRFDYTPEDCQKFHESIEKEVMPVLRQLHVERRAQLKLPALRPWDLAVDPLNLPALRPFEGMENLLSTTHDIFT
ncbi:MAG TPA: M3 family metallopeptidase, partial [Candidatus Saccharimonadales bacterium]|nr:M3 family metallopeptidase [Candidatus Saccharimonadales bacterium]